MMVILGCCEITLVSLLAVAGLKLPPAYRFPGIAALLAAGLAFGHAVSPAWNSWFSNIVPSEIRSTYIGRRMLIITGVGMAYLFLASRWLDVAPKPLGFLPIFILGWFGGVAGYMVAARTPYPRIAEQTASPGHALWRPLRERAYLRLCLFLLAWAGASMFAGAFYSIYMLRHLKLSYSLVAVFTNITLLTTMVGYAFWGSVTQRFGNRPFIQLLSVPAALVPFLWGLTDHTNYPVLITISSVVGGLCGSGISVAMSSLLYKTIPQGREVPEYFVLWTCFNTLGATTGPLLGGLFAQRLTSAQVDVLGVQVSGMQLLFATGGLLMLFPIALSLLLEETQAASPMYVLGQFRGNLFSFAYNSALYGTTRQDEKRANRLRALGRSRSPLALSALMEGLRDASPAVRQGAAEGLGESGLSEGLEPLVSALEDEESDIRPVAAEALGRLRKPESVSPLIQALYDDDLRLRNSAAMALGEIGGREARDALYYALTAGFDRRTFPTLVDAASRTGDLRLVEPAMEHLHDLASPVLRMQVLNAVGRVLGERNHFYRLRLADELGRASLVEKMMARIIRLAKAVKLGDEKQRAKLQALAQDVSQAAATDDYRSLVRACKELATTTLALEGAREVSQAAARALLLYLSHHDDLPEGEALIFLTICLTSLLRHMVAQSRSSQVEG